MRCLLPSLSTARLGREVISAGFWGACQRQIPFAPVAAAWALLFACHVVLSPLLSAVEPLICLHLSIMRPQSSLLTAAVSIIITTATAAALAQYRPPQSYLRTLHSRSGGLDLDAEYKPGFRLLFFDAFSGPPGSLPSSANWLLDTGTKYPSAAAPPRWGNNEVETYTNSPANVHITPQHTLSITPLRDSASPNGTEAVAWTSARIETLRSFGARACGRLFVEARLALGAAPSSRQQGIWPAFWALGKAFRANITDWPGASEWDLLESINGAPTMFATAHCGVAPGGPCNEYNGLSNGGVAFSRGEFHTVGLMVDRSKCDKDDENGSWRDEKLVWFLDGQNVFNISGERVADKSAWEQLAHREHFLLLNVAVGGNWPGPPNNLTLDGIDVGMEVDYVGVWDSQE